MDNDSDSEPREACIEPAASTPLIEEITKASAPETQKERNEDTPSTAPSTEEIDKATYSETPETHDEPTDGAPHSALLWKRMTQQLVLLMAPWPVRTGKNLALGEPG